MPKESLLDKVKAQEIIEDNGTRTKKAIVNKIVSSDSSKDKQISAKINSTVYEQFTKINKTLGVSNNSAINMCITRYIRDNKAILDD